MNWWKPGNTHKECYWSYVHKVWDKSEKQKQPKNNIDEDHANLEQNLG